MSGLTLYTCDYCGTERTHTATPFGSQPYAAESDWGFPPDRWLHLKWGGDPMYSPESIMCPACQAERGVVPQHRDARRGEET